MTRTNLIPGIGGLVFGISMFIALFLASAPGGDYSASDIAKYLDDGHRDQVVVSLYLAFIAIAGLICLLTGLRAAIAPGQEWAGRVIWGSGLAAATAIVVGWAIVATPSASLAIGGGQVVDPRVTYLVTQVGWAVALGAGGLLLGFALIVLMIASAGMLPAWVRWLTLIAAILAISSIIFITFLGVLVWAVVVGGWFVASARVEEPRAVMPPA